jgi:hypothetical protein
MPGRNASASGETWGFQTVSSRGWGVVRRAIVGAVLIGVVLSGCSNDPASEPSQQIAKKVEKRERPPRPPQRADARSVKSNLNLKNIRGCLYDEPVGIAALAPSYYSPQGLVEGELEKVRDLDVEAPEIEMLDEKAFEHELRKTNLHLTTEQKKVNQWLNWNLGFAPFSSRSKPDGDGSDLVAGFYTRGGHIVIHQRGDLDGEYFTLAHELAHAADDQHFGLPRTWSRRTIDDEAMALDALVEGAATLAELRLESLLLSNQKAVDKGIKELLTSRQRFKKDEEDGVLHLGTDRFIFPYRWGVSFVCSVFRKEGWRGVNRAFRNPPESTAEIMFPKRYLERDRVRKPPPFKQPAKHWKPFAKGTIGPAHLKAMFEAPADQRHRAMGNPLGRAAAWDGGVYRLWARKVQGVNTIFGMSFAEHKGHKDVLCSSMIKWYEETFRLAQREVIADEVVSFDEALRGGVIDCRGGNVQVAIGPNVHSAKSIIDL